MRKEYDFSKMIAKNKKKARHCDDGCPFCKLEKKQPSPKKKLR